jgi:hypothetical protein
VAVIVIGPVIVAVNVNVNSTVIVIGPVIDNPWLVVTPALPSSCRVRGGEQRLRL